MYIYVKTVFTQNNQQFACGVYLINEDFAPFVDAWKAAGKVEDATADQIAEYQGQNPNPGAAGGLIETTANFTTAVLPDQDEASGAVNLGKVFIITKVEANRAARVRIYNSIAARDADQGRAIGEAHTGEGLIAEIVFTDQINAVNLSPLANGATAETPRASTCPITVQNLAGEDVALEIIFSKITLEN